MVVDDFDSVLLSFDLPSFLDAESLAESLEPESLDAESFEAESLDAESLDAESFEDSLSEDDPEDFLG